MACNLLHATPVLHQKCCMQHFSLRRATPPHTAWHPAIIFNFLPFNIPQRERLTKKRSLLQRFSFFPDPVLCVSRGMCSECPFRIGGLHVIRSKIKVGTGCAMSKVGSNNTRQKREAVLPVTALSVSGFFDGTVIFRTTVYEITFLQGDQHGRKKKDTHGHGGAYAPDRADGCAELGRGWP